MGWFNDETPGHEGFIAGSVERPGGFRELAYPVDNDEAKLTHLQAACECGWRSSRWSAEAEWVPFSVLAHRRDEDRAHSLWEDHVRAHAGKGADGR